MRLRRVSTLAATGAVGALAAASPWATVDFVRVLGQVEIPAPLSLATFAFVLSAVAAIPAGALLGLGSAWTGGDHRRALAAGAGVAFVVWGLIVVGVPLNQSVLPSRWHPISIAADALLLIVLLAMGRWIARLVGGPRGVALAAAALVVSVGTSVGLSAFANPRAVHVGQRRASPQGAPNLLFVVVDSLRASDGDVDGNTPTLRDVGAAGTTFTRSYSASSWTKPSVATLLTGLAPATHGAVRHLDVLRQDVTTLAEALGQAGYRTATFSANPWVSPAFGFGQGVEHFVESDPGGEVTRLMALVRPVQLVERALPRLSVGAGLQRLRTALGLDGKQQTNCARDAALTSSLASWLADGPEPFFAYVHYMSAHLPYEAPGPRRIERARQLELSRGDAAPTATELAAMRAEYLEAVRYVDGQLLTLLTTLDARGMRERTLVVVTADHGEEFAEHRQLGHGKSLYREVVQVPLVVRFPGRLAAGARIDAPVGSSALFGLLLQLLDLPGAPAADGGVVLDAGRLVPASSRRPVRLALDLEAGFSAASLVTGRIQYIETTTHFGADPRRELYDLRRDPAEQKDRWQPGSAKGERLARLLGASEPLVARGATPQAVVGTETTARLRALGYVQ